MSYQSYKGRVIDPSMPVRVYRNLHNGMLSVQQCGVVVAHVHSINLSSATFIVSEAGRQRVIRDKKKNVHAFVGGMVAAINPPPAAIGDRQRVTYNPYKAAHFVAALGRPAHAGDKQVNIDTTAGMFIIH